MDASIVLVSSINQHGHQVGPRIHTCCSGRLTTSAPRLAPSYFLMNMHDLSEHRVPW